LQEKLSVIFTVYVVVVSGEATGVVLVGLSRVAAGDHE